MSRRRSSGVIGAGELVECVRDDLVAIELGAMRHPGLAVGPFAQCGDGELAPFDEGAATPSATGMAETVRFEIAEQHSGRFDSVAAVPVERERLDDSPH